MIIGTKHSFPWPDAAIPHYTAYRVTQPPALDGRLDAPPWLSAPRSRRFVDLVTGNATIHDTRAAVLWDDEHLYIGFWVEEPFVSATMTERDAPIYEENDVEVFIAGNDAYYELEVNPLGTVYEALFVWDEAYERSGYAAIPELQRDAAGFRKWHGVGFTEHPRGGRSGFFRWDLPGLRTAVHVDGVINDPGVRDRGWTVEIAIPWSGLHLLAMPDSRSLPPDEGDVWRMDFSRFNVVKEAPPATDSGGWAWSPHGVWDSHIPECFPYIHFTREMPPAEMRSGVEPSRRTG